jgi:hypothetical protein
VPDDPLSDNRTPVPGIVDVLSVETVEPLVARHEEELAALRLELEDALREAEAAEQSVNRHPAASVFDDAFEADVLARVAESLAKVDGSGDQGVADTVSAPEAAASLARGTPAPSASDSPAPAVVDSSAPESSPGSSVRPRTVVVDRGSPRTPRTVVVDRGRPSSGPSPPPPPPVAPVLVGDLGAAQLVDAQASAQAPASVRKRKGGKKKGNLLARLPARIFIQAGVIIVIVALLMLKLA